MWTLRDEVLCPDWKVQSADVSGDQTLWKAPKRLFHPCLRLPERGEWDAQQDPPFSMVLSVLRKSLCTMVAVMAEAVQGWCCFFPSRHKASRCEMGAGRDGGGLGVGSGKRWGQEWAGQQGACRHSRTKQSRHSAERRGCLKAAQSLVPR